MTSIANFRVRVAGPLALCVIGALIAGPATAQMPPVLPVPAGRPAMPSVPAMPDKSAMPAMPDRGPPPQAFEDCKGRAEGAAIRHRTPQGEVAATCVKTPAGLAARPDLPPKPGLPAVPAVPAVPAIPGVPPLPKSN